MKRNPKNPNSALQKEDPTIKKNDELGEDELNKVTGGGKLVEGTFTVRKASGNNTTGTV